MRTYMAFVMSVAFSVAWAQEQSVIAPRLLKSEDLPTAVEAEALQRQYDALVTMAPTKIQYTPRGPVAVVRARDTGPALPARIRDLKEGSEAADAILPAVGDLLLARGNESLRVQINGPIDPVTWTLRLEQSIRGIPVIGGLVAIDYDESTMRIKVLAANFIPDRGLPTKPVLSAKEAEQVIPAALRSADDMRDAEIEIIEGTYLAYYANASEADAPQLVWVVQISLNGVNEQLLVNAVTGAIAGRVPQTLSIALTFYNANGGHPTIPSGLGSPINPDSIVDSKYARDQLQDADVRVVQQLPYAGTFRPNSARVIVKYVWQLSPQYRSNYQHIGQYDYLTFSPAASGVNPWTKPRDVVDHEYGHSIAWRMFGWAGETNPHSEIGATHEFFADFYATALDASYSNRGWNSDLTWRIAEGLFTSSSSMGLRSLKRPRTDNLSFSPHKNWYPTRSLGLTQEDDNGTILGHAFYLSIFGGQNEDVADPAIPDIQVAPLNGDLNTSAEMAKLIFFRGAVDSEMAISPYFRTLKERALVNADTQYPGGAARTTIENAFDAVGICSQDTAPPSSVSNFNLEDLMCAGRFNASWTLSPNVSRYYAEVAPAQLGFSFATPVTDVDGSTSHCFFQVTGPMVYRIQACNSCGCGPWSQTAYLPYWSPCP